MFDGQRRRAQSLGNIVTHRPEPRRPGRAVIGDLHRQGPWLAMYLRIFTRIPNCEGHQRSRAHLTVAKHSHGPSSRLADARSNVRFAAACPILIIHRHHFAQ
ncbi:hypothetical protein [Kerstersia gyiorum]|jgi:hypothetical protein|uniref:hypothetical protein n=1 Tax=Kerstersia gyiorum TaxID=206506 RepID=UPI00242C666D|nr:hypothetical protein [Kerstersia gyiorum]MCH4273302.1 hypothetical protein [Kerstersia gyiorum]MCI1229508.1 hypothetical protein [Kerstersia gyiorum]